jgi:hypothetical protein
LLITQKRSFLYRDSCRAVLDTNLRGE